MTRCSFLSEVGLDSIASCTIFSHSTNLLFNIVVPAYDGEVKRLQNTFAECAKLQDKGQTFVESARKLLSSLERKSQKQKARVTVNPPHGGQHTAVVIGEHVLLST